MRNLPYELRLADLLREDLAAEEDLSEKTMFGGLAFLVGGHMVCGVNQRGALFRVAGRDEPQALDLPGAEPMKIGGRRQSGMIEVPHQFLEDAPHRARMLRMALDFVRRLPPK